MWSIRIAKCAVSVCLILTALVAPSGAAPPMTADALYKSALPSIATLVVTRQDGAESQGSAFLAIKDGIAVTAYHVVDQASTVTARFATGEEFDVSGVIDTDPKRDIALVRIKVFGRPLLALNGQAPDIGSRAYVIGAPRGLEFTISDGLVSQLPVFEGVKRVQFSCPASPGNSGGPLLDGLGRVIGVVSSQIADGQNLNFAIPAEYVLGLDASLPTTPWEKVVASVKPAAVSTSQRECDQLLLESFIWRSDLRSTYGLVLHFTVNKRNGFTSGVPSYLYSAQMTGQKLAERLAQPRVSDPGRSIVLQRQIESIRLDLQSIELLIGAIREAQTANGWNATANDRLARFFALAQTAGSNTASDDSTSIKAMQSVAVEISNLDGCPRLASAWLRNEPDISGFTLGCRMFMRDELLFGDVVAGSPGDKLGLEPGDRILSLDGKKPDGLEDFKVMLKAACGKTVAIVIFRDGKEKTLRPVVPRDLANSK